MAGSVSLPSRRSLSDGLAQHLLVGREVEQVVHHLEADAEVQAVARQRLLALGARLGQDAGDVHAGREEVGRLAPDDVEVVGLGRGQVAVALDLQQLALDHAQRHVGEQAQDAQVVLRERHGHRLRVEEVAEPAR